MVGPKGLCGALLRLALRDARRGGGRYAQSAIEWIDSNRRQGVFDFVRICETLDLSPEEVRRVARNGSGRTCSAIPTGY